MKKFFAIALLAFAAFYVIAQVTLDKPDPDVIHLRWATDPNPARNVQKDLFAKLQILLRPDDVADWPAFCARIEEAGRTAGRTPARRLRDLLGPDAKAQVRAIAHSAPETPPAGVIEALNRILGDPAFYREADFASVPVPQTARDLLARPRGDLSDLEVVTLNRLLLDAAFPGLVRKARRVEVTVESPAFEKLTVQCATGTGPDVIDIYSRAEMLSYVESGILVDLTPYADKMGFGLKDTYPAIGDVLTVDGRQYRFPCNVWANCVAYNKKVFDDHGLPYPKNDWTYDEFIAVAKQIINTPSRSGEKHLAAPNWYNLWTYEDLLIGHGGRFYTADGLQSQLDSEESLAAIRLYYEMMHVHHIIPTPAEAVAMTSQGGWGAGATNLFFGERAAMILIGRWMLVQVSNYPDIIGHLGAVQLPHLPGRPSSGMTDSRAAAVTVNSRHQETALEFLRYLASPEYGRVITEDGDALPPNPALARTGADLVNRVAPDAAFHQPFIDAVQTARPLDASPFIDAGQVDRWLLEAIERVESKLDEPEVAMKSLASEINRRIRTNLERRPDLQERYRQITGRPYSKDWWRTYEPPAPSTAE